MNILIFGDSHSKLFELTEELREINPNFRAVEVNVIALRGATITGFGKRKSALNTNQVFIEKVKEYKPDIICFALGQVDIELGYYYRRVVKKENVDFQCFVSELISKYIDNITSLLETIDYSKDQIIFKGVNLSVLTNSREKAVRYTSRILNANVKNIVERRKLRGVLNKEFPSNLERSYFHVYFNQKMETLVHETGMKYFDINSFIQAPNNKNIVDFKYIPAKFDHHLTDSLYMRNIHLETLVDTAASISV